MGSEMCIRDSNYSLAAGAATGQITAKALSVTAPAIAPRAYDSTRTAGAVTVGTITGEVPGQVVTATAVAADYASANVGWYSNVVVTYMLHDGSGGGWATNYSLAAGAADGQITAKALSVTAPSIASKGYDGTASAGALTVGTLSGFVGSESVTATGAAANYSSANVGSYSGVVITYTLHNGTGGGLAANYSLANGAASGQITAKALSVTAPLIASKGYDGTATAGAVAVGTLSGFVGSERVTATGAAADYPSADVGTYPGVDIIYTLHNGRGGGLAANYSLANGTATGQITPRALTVAGISASDKVYDGTTNATLILTNAALAGNLDGTNVVLSTTNATGAFADPNVGSNKPVQVSGLTLSGSATNNYAFSQPATNATITGKALNITAKADAKTYGEVKTYGPGQTAFTTGAGELVSGDSVTSVTLACADGGPATAVVGSYDIIPSAAVGIGVENYLIRYQAGVLTVGKATGTVTLGGLTQTYNGTARSVTTATAPLVLPVNVTYNGSATAPTNAGSYTVSGTINSANYEGGSTNTLVVSALPATVTLGNLSQTYNGAARTASASTIPAGLSLNVTYNGSATAPVNVGSYTVVALVSSPNYTGGATNTLVVGKATQTINLALEVTNSIPLNQFTNPIVVTATASSGLPVTLTLDAGSTATLTETNTLVNVSQSGTITLRANQAGNSNYTAAAEQVVVLDVTKVAQTIRFAAVADQVATNAPVTLSATASSGLAVQYTVASGPATVSGNQLTLTGAGVVTVAVDQPGNASYNAAETVNQRFNVSAAL